MRKLTCNYVTPLSCFSCKLRDCIIDGEITGESDFSYAGGHGLINPIKETKELDKAKKNRERHRRRYLKERKCTAEYTPNKRGRKAVAAYAGSNV